MMKTSSECVFCKIVKGEIPSTKVFEDERCIAFLDINPQAKEHILVIPKVHVPSLDESADGVLLAHLLLMCVRVAAQRGLANGYRVVTNIGSDARQSVQHLHFHILGGEKLSENMG